MSNTFDLALTVHELNTLQMLLVKMKWQVFEIEYAFNKVWHLRLSIVTKRLEASTSIITHEQNLIYPIYVFLIFNCLSAYVKCTQVLSPNQPTRYILLLKWAYYWPFIRDVYLSSPEELENWCTSTLYWYEAPPLVWLTLPLLHRQCLWGQAKSITWQIYNTTYHALQPRRGS